MKDTIKKQIEYWEGSAERDWKTALSLFKFKRYDSCLFFCHLTLEKLLKSLVTKKTNQPAPYIHDLEKLASLAVIVLTENQKQNLRDISTFNISGRYDDIKLSFYKKCTKGYAEKYLSIAKQLYLWLKK